MLSISEDIVLSGKKLRSIVNNPVKSAAAARLLYVSDSQPGIRRLKKGKKFIYLSRKKQITDSKSLTRFKKLVIPPAWSHVWICPFANGHLQATGYDIKKKKAVQISHLVEYAAKPH